MTIKAIGGIVNPMTTTSQTFGPRPYGRHAQHRRHLMRDDCTCVFSCADDQRTRCSLSGEWHVHPASQGIGFGACPAHPEAPGDL